MSPLIVGAVVQALVACVVGASPRPAKADAVSLYEQLGQVIDFEAIDDPKQTLDHALDALAEKYRLVLEVNERAFKLDGVMDPLKTQIADPNPILVKRKVRLEEVLQLILDRVPAQSGATFVRRARHIEITTKQFVAAEFWGRDYDGPMSPLVDLKMRDERVDHALKRLAKRHDLSLLIDRRVATRARKRVTLDVANLPANVAVALLADQAGLQAVKVGAFYYVTTPPNALAFKRRFVSDGLGTPKFWEWMPAPR